MHKHWLGAAAALAVAFGMHNALAENLNACPDGQAIQASDPSGKKIRCIPVPPPVDVSGLQDQINAEAAARAAGDGTLLGAIADERSARIAADDELRASSGVQEGIPGTYAVSGTQVCTTGSQGFNSNLQPFIAPQPPFDPSNPEQPPVITIVSVSSSMVYGTQTFNADGTGSVDVVYHVVTHPGALFGVPGTAGAGGGSVSTSVGAFTWSVTADGKLIVDGVEPRTGLVVKGGTPGTTLSSTGVPALAGVLGKDRRLITMMNADVAPETVVFTNPNGFVSTQSRICIRERTLRKL